MSVELSENFYISNKRKRNVKIHVKLNEEGICLRREPDQSEKINEHFIRIEDIIGSRCGPRQRKRIRGGLSSCKRLPKEEQTEDEHFADGAEGSSKDISAYLYIYAYVKKENPSRRVRTVRILRFRTHESYEENLKSAERWQQTIIMLIKENPTGEPPSPQLQDRKEVLILLNPKSGSCKGREMFQKQVVPVLQDADMAYELHVTKYANFAREFVHTKRDLLQRYRGIIVAAGDGLFYEVLNGLMERDDWQLISRHLPIGIIPCGSGNGLAKSIAHLYDEPYEPKQILNATLTCVSGRSAPMDVVRIEVAQKCKQIQMYSFLSVGWGLIADIDIESERLRSIGAQRFTLWSIRRLLNLRTYEGKVFYLPWQRRHHEKEQVARLPNRDFEEFHDLPEIDEELYEKEVECNDEFVDVVSLGCNSSVGPYIDSWHSATSRRTAYYSIATQSACSHRSVASKIEAAAAEYKPQTPASTIPALNMPLPMETWRCIEGEFVMVQSAYTTHLMSDCFFSPSSRLNDGIIYLVIIRAGIGRSQLLQFLLNMSSGTHLPEQPNEHIQILPVTAFRIEPRNIDVDGIITVDGERVDYGAIQGEVFPGLIRVMVPK